MQFNIVISVRCQQANSMNQNPYREANSSSGNHLKFLVRKICCQKSLKIHNNKKLTPLLLEKNNKVNYGPQGNLW